MSRLQVQGSGCQKCQVLFKRTKQSMGSGMGNGPALALLLPGPALSVASMLVIGSVLGTKKSVVYLSLVVSLVTIAGLAYGSLFGAR